MNAGFVYDPVYLRHDTGAHPESSRRLEAIVSRLERTGLKEELIAVSPRPATEEELALVHTRSHIARVREMAQRGGGWFDPDTVMSAGSYEAALYAAGGLIEAVEAVLDGHADSVFALVRPPGHHATAEKAMGFCLFNNIAIGARYAFTQRGLERVCIIDYDVHHGNGTQGTFYEDPDLLYISLHQYPHYPGSGWAEETGKGRGAGATVNVPLPAGCGDAEYERVFEKIVIPATMRFRPQLIMASAGFDGHRDDPLADMCLTVAGFAGIAEAIEKLSEELCHGRLVLALEGGYNLEALAESVRCTFDVLKGREPVKGTPREKLPSAGRDIGPLLKKVSEIHGLIRSA